MPFIFNHKSMFYTLCLGVVLGLSPKLHAQTSVQLDLKPEMKLESYHSSRKKRFANKSKTSGLKLLGTTYPRVDIAETYTINTNKTYQLFAHIIDGSKPAVNSPFAPNIRNVHVKTTFKQESPNVSLVQVKLNESRPLDAVKGTVTLQTKSKRTRHTWTGIFSNPLVNGTVRIAYTFPANTWLVKVRRLQADNILNLIHLSQRKENPEFKGFFESLTGNLDPGLLENDVLVWGEPGSTIYQEFSYHRVTEDLAGQLQFRFETIRYPYPLSIANTLAEIDKSIETLKSGVTNLDEKFKAQEIMIALIADRLGSAEALREVIDKLSTLEVIDLVNNLATIRDMIFIDHKFADVKVASTLLSFRLAHDYLKELLPFCETATIDLPYQNRELKASWLTISSFLLQRVAIRLEHYSVAHFRALISGISDYQQQGLSYADVRNNNTEYAKIMKAYKALSSSTNLRESPFTASSTEIDYILGNVGSLGEGGAKSAQLREAMLALAEKEKNFNRDLVNKIRMFQPNNKNAVDVSDLQTRIQDIEVSVGLAIDALANGSQLLSVSETGLYALTELIMNLGLNHISVYRNPMQNDFEYFRTQYFDQDELTIYSTSVNKCIVGEK